MINLVLAEPFIIRALLAGIAIAVVCGVLGCFIVWRRMAYFGDSLAHSALLGIAFGVLSGFNMNIAIIAVCLFFAVVLVTLQQSRILAIDTLLGILAHGSLSLGIVIISFFNNPNFNLHNYLFGDILIVSFKDLCWIYGGGILALVLLIFNWSDFVLITINEDLARAEGVRVFEKQLIFMTLVTIVVAVSIHIIGVLLITSLLIIPAATARQFSCSPSLMAVIAVLFGIIAVILGINVSFYYDLPSGPSIVAGAALLFILLFPLAILRAGKNYVGR